MEKEGTRKRTRSKAFQPKYNRAAKISHNKSAKRYNYGANNLLPNQLLKAIEASVTASSCRGRKHEFIEGNGLKEKGNASLIINPGQTADDLVAELSDYSGAFDGVSVVVKYNLMGDQKHMYALPFECVRKADNGQYYYNEKLAEGKDEKKTRVYYDEFDRKETPDSRLLRVRAQIDEYGYQTGDIIYLFAKKAGQADYPIPIAWAGMEEIEADAALGRLDWRNVKKGFRPDVIITTVGEIDNVTKDENDKTDQDHFDKNLEAFTGEDAAPVLHLQVDNVEQLPKVDKFDSKNVLNSTTEAENRIGRRVCRAMEVPDVLVPGFARQGQLGNNQEMINLLKLFANTIGRKQRLITRVLEQIWPKLDWTIEPLVLIEELPKWLLETMTGDEKRQLGGLDKLEGETITTAQRLSALSPLVATKVLEEMSSEEVRELIDLEGSRPDEGIVMETTE